jgi:hypothetical protein
MWLGADFNRLPAAGTGLILPADEKVEVAECSVNNKSSRFI